MHLRRDRLSPSLHRCSRDCIHSSWDIYIYIDICICIYTFFSRGVNLVCTLVVSSNISYAFQNIDLPKIIAERTLGERYLILSGDQAKLKTAGAPINR